LATKTFREFGGYVVSEGPYVGFRVACLSFISTLFGTSHSYYKEFDSTVNDSYTYNTERGVEILKSIKNEIEQGWLTSIRALVVADVFADFVEMAEHLLKEGYKDAAAIILGSVLEDTLRKIALRNGIAITNDKGKPLTIEPLNIEVAKKEVYNSLIKKQVTAWADLRNNAAHGHYDEYNSDQVKDMLTYVTHFTATYIT
jgi:hypothetical protein